MVLLIGILLGWLIEYAIDWFFWRRRSTDEKIVTDLQDQLRASEERSAELEAQLAETKSDSEIWQSRAAELESELAAITAKVEKVSKVDQDEFRGSLKGKLAAIGVGAAVGAAISSGEDGEEEIVVPDDELVDEVAMEVADDDSFSAEDESIDEVAVDADEETFNDISEMEEVEEAVEDEEPASAEDSAEESVESGADEGSETLAAGADPADEVETAEEVETADEVGSADKDIEPEESEPDMEDSADTSETYVSDSSFDAGLPDESTNAADENASTTSEGGQEP